MDNRDDPMSDITVTDVNGTLLDRELVYICTSTKELELWVRVPHLSSTHNTRLYVYYGNQDYSTNNSRTTWDKHYMLVNHMGNAMVYGEAMTRDSTIYNTSCHSPFPGDPVEEAGMIGHAQNFTNTRLTCVGHPEFNTTNSTIETWIWPSTAQGATARTVASRYFTFRLVYGANNINNRGAYIVRSGGSWHPSGQMVITEKQWSYFGGRYNSTNISAWLNDALGSIAWDAGLSPEENTNPFYIACHSNQPFKGIVDEVRYSNISRSPGYLKTNDNMVRHQDWFLEVACPEQAPALVPRHPENLMATYNETSGCAELNWTAGANTTTTYIRVSVGACPATILHGDFVVNTSGITTVYCGGDFDFSEYCFSAWGMRGTTYSAVHACTCEGGEGMTLIAYLFALLFLPVALTAFAFWQKKGWLYLGAVMAWVATGFYGLTQHTTGDTLWIVGVVGMFMAFVLAIVSMGQTQVEQEEEGPEESEEESYSRDLQEMTGRRRAIRRGSRGLD
jgi:hypothetical protein